MSCKVLFLAAEASPLVKVGGLADVAGALPQALRRLGHDVRLALPKYGVLKANNLRREGSFWIDILGRREEVTLWEAPANGEVPAYLLGHEDYFERRNNVYGEGDDLERFLLFSQAALALPERIGWQPDILHGHDWHSAAAIVLLRASPYARSYASCASVFTVHNLAYRGWLDDSFVSRAGLYPYLPPPEDPLRPRSYSLLALALLHADVINTVSETYAREVLTPEYGEGLEPILERRKDRLHGVLNGLDYQQYNPATDPLLAVNYDASSLERRLRNKLALQERAGLARDPAVPLLGMVGRLAGQKGLDILAEALGPLLREEEVQFVLLGQGEERIRQALEGAAGPYPGKARLLFSFDQALAQLIYAGCDLFLMPSRYEPCGLGQLIALRYGAIPVVRRTGGLADTVQECTPDLAQGNGFVFAGYNAGELLAAIKRGLAAFARKDAWRQLQVRAMQADFSWGASARRYASLYEQARGYVR